MSKGLKGITVKIDGDTTPLNKALEKVNAESKSLQGELKGVNSLLKFDPQNTELLAQKQTVLSQAIGQTEDKLKTLLLAQKQMNEEGKNADNSAEYRDLQREIAATQQKLAGYNTQLENTQRTQKTLSEALADTEEKSKAFTNELDKINASLKNDSNNADLLAQKQTVLRQAIAETEEKLKLLAQAQQKAAESGKDINDAEYRDLQREIAATQQKLAGYNTQLKNTQNAQKQAAKEAETLGQKIYKIASHIPVVNRLADGFVKAKQKITETVKESAAVQKIGSTVEGAKQKVEAFKDAHPAVKKISDSFRDVKEKVTGLKNELPLVQQALERVGSAAASVSVGLLKVGAVAAGALATGFGLTIKIADEAKGALNDFSASTGITGDNLKEFEGVMKEIYADNFGENIQDVAESMALVQKNSRLIDPAETKKVTEYALALRDTFGYDIQEQMRAANMLMDQFGITSDEAFNLIAQGAQSGWLDKNGDMLDSINEYSVHFKQLGLDAENMFNMLANGSYSGTFSVDKCGDAIKEFGIRVKDGSDSSRAAFEYLGYDADKLFKTFNEGGAEAADMTQIIIDELASMPESVEKTTAGVALFGTMWEDLGAEGIQALSDMTGEFDKSYDAMQQINSIKYDTFGEAMQGVGRTLQMNFIAPIGEAALPVFTEFAQELSKGALEAEGDVEKMADAASDAVEGLLDGLSDMIPQILQIALPIIEGLTSALVLNIPMIINGALPPLMHAFSTLIQTVTGALPTLLPQILNAAVTLFGGLLQGLNETIPQIMAMLPTLIQTISQTLIANLPQLVTAGVQILVNLISGITQAIPSLISAIVELIPVIVQTVMENLPLIIDAGLNLLLALVNGIVQAIPQLIAMLPTIIDTIVTQIVSMLPKIIETGIQLLNALVSGIIQAIPQLIAALPQVITSTVNTITANLPKIIQTGIELLGALISGIIQAIPALIAALPQVFKAIIDTFKGVNWADLGKNIIDGVINGVRNAAGNLINVFKELANSALDSVKETLGIHSPSTVFRDEVGKQIPAGMALGVEDGMDEQEKRIKAAIQRGVPTTIDSYIKSSGSSTGSESTVAAGGSNFVQNLTINSPRELSPYETAKLNRRAMQQTILRLKPT